MRRRRERLQAESDALRLEARAAVIDAVNAGYSHTEIATALGVSRQTLYAQYLHRDPHDLAQRVSDRHE